ncbi:SsrA-binding protein [Bacilli bacterium]|nr:SsrA-binding protein [Bacilli bacterium]
MKTLLTNNKLNLNYEVDSKYEAGMSLLGKEVKSLLHADAGINEAFVLIKNNQAYLINMYIAPLKNALNEHYEPKRKRKLLLNKHEIINIDYQTKKNKFAIIASSVYIKNGKIKIEIALARAKRKHDKRESIKERDAIKFSKKFISK